MSFRRFAVGAATSASTPTSPVIDTSDYYVFSVNPSVMDGQHAGGQLITTLAGAPRVTTTQTPLETFALRWQKISSTAKKDETDDYFNRNTKLVLINDQNYAWEVVIVPGSYRANRRRSVAGTAESYTCEVSIYTLGGGKQLTVVDTGYVTPMG